MPQDVKQEAGRIFLDKPNLEMGVDRASFTKSESADGSIIKPPGEYMFRVKLAIHQCYVACSDSFVSFRYE